MQTVAGGLRHPACTQAVALAAEQADQMCDRDAETLEVLNVVDLFLYPELPEAVSEGTWILRVCGHRPAPRAPPLAISRVRLPPPPQAKGPEALLLALHEALAAYPECKVEADRTRCHLIARSEEAIADTDADADSRARRVNVGEAGSTPRATRLITPRAAAPPRFDCPGLPGAVKRPERFSI